MGDFNANAASRTLQSLWGHLHAVYNSKSFGGVDNILANVGKDDVLIGEEIGSGTRQRGGSAVRVPNSGHAPSRLFLGMFGLVWAV